MVSPGNPSLAAKLAEAAGSVSHDGQSVHAAKLWAAMEAEAFISRDVDHLLTVGLRYVPGDSLIAKLVADIRGWAKIDDDWEKTRQRIEDIYGYAKFPGNCHIVPNHGLMIMTLIYAGHDFRSAMHIINTCGWDTDCNSGNIGCLVAIMHGLSAFEGGQDWRGPLADQALISSADGGYSINNAARITYDIANLGRQLAGEQPLPPPKYGAQYHFSLPGSVQGFVATRNELYPDLVKIEQATDSQSRTSLAIHISGWAHGIPPVEALTQTFTPPSIVKMATYDLMATPLISPGQKVTAILRASSSNTSEITASIRLKHYNSTDTLSPFDGPASSLSPGEEATLIWTIPDVFDAQPIQALGLALSATNPKFSGTVHLDSLSYSGSPRTTLTRPQKRIPNEKPCQFWKRAWIDNVSTFHSWSPEKSFYLAQDSGEGLFYTGTRDWKDYRVTVPNFMISMGSAGIIVRVQGLNRFYAFAFRADRKSVVLVKARDEERVELASARFEWDLDVPQRIVVLVKGSKITALVADEQIIEAEDEEYAGGGIGATIVDGSVAIDQFDIAPLT